MTTTEIRTNAHPGSCRSCHGTVEVGEGRLIDRTCGGRVALARVNYRWDVEHLDRDVCAAVYAASPAGQAEARKAAAHAAKAAEKEAEQRAQVERAVALGNVSFDPWAKRGTLSDGATTFVVRHLPKSGWYKVLLNGEKVGEVVTTHAAAARFLVAIDRSGFRGLKA
jgi:hypothetical protein